MFRALMPSIVADAIWPERRPTWKIHPTSYLDGLRGFASFIVFICHYTEERHAYFVPSYGLNETEASAFIQLPYFRLIYSGRPMVHIFFVISGFVLSTKPLKQLHARDFEQCYTTLASSVFRRPTRLLLPCSVSTLGIAFLAQCGYLYIPAVSVWQQLSDWKNVFFHDISWPWAWDFDLHPGYDIHLWTIPIEFVHSMLLFLVLLGLSRLRTGLRQVANVLLIVYCMCCGKWAGFEFLAGMFLAELHVLQQMHLSRGIFHLGSSSSGRSSSTTTTFFDGALSPVARGWQAVCLFCGPLLKMGFYSTVLLMAFYVAGWPNINADKTPVIDRILARTPTPFLEGDLSQKFWFGVAAILIVWSCGEVDAIRRFLDGSVAQYCGRISYAIYIVHGPGLAYFQDRVLGQPATPARGVPGTGDFEPAFMGSGIKGMIGVGSPAQRVMAWFVGLVILGPIVVWIADLFWRFVDAPIVKLGRALENAVIDKGDEEDEEYKLVASVAV